MRPIQQSFEGFPPIADQMPAIKNVLGRWCAQCGAPRLFRRKIAADDGDTRMGPEPGREHVI
jgi:hypothetical protein